MPAAAARAHVLREIRGAKGNSRAVETGHANSTAEEPMKIFHSLQTKLTLSFVALVLTVSGLTFLYTFGETKDALKESVRSELGAVASSVAVMLEGADAEAMAALRPGDEPGVEFTRLADRLRRLRQGHPDIRYVYTMRRHGDAVQFLVDPEFGNADDPGAAIHQPYDEVTPALLAGFEALSVQDDFTVDKWGTLMSGFAPLRDRQGKTIGLVGVDISLQQMLAKQSFIGGTIYLIMGLGIAVAALFIFLFSKTIIRDIKSLNQAAHDVSLGAMNSMVTVERKDEIGELADSFGRMVTSLKIMSMERDELAQTTPAVAGEGEALDVAFASADHGAAGR
jgi:adenylate cyclase